MTEIIIQSRFLYRLFEILIPISSWLIITLPLWLSPFHPAVVAYFIISFDIYFLYKSLKVTYLAAVSYKKILITNKINFAKKLNALKSSVPLYHFVIIPNYKEPLHKLRETIMNITSSDYPSTQICLVLAFEKRETNVKEKSRLLNQEFSSKFKQIITTFHPLTTNEVAGKSSNQTFAAKQIESFVKKNHWPDDQVLITICDADSRLPRNYFSYLSYRYLQDPDRHYHFYWAPVLLYNNFWQLPLFVRIQATLSSIVRLAYLSWGDNLIHISTYSTSLFLLKRVNYWDVNVIPEDWHIYLQALFTLGDKVKTIPLYTFVNGDAVYSGKLIKTLTNRYEQEKRWAWGVSDIAYALRKSFTETKPSFKVKLTKLLFLIETHLLWPTSFFILTVSASVPPLINPIFKRTVLGFLLPKLSGLILTIASSLLIVYIYLDIKLRQNIKQKTKITALPLLIVQWYLLPIVSFILSSLPALDAHTKLLFGKRIEYKVTEKV